MSKVQLVSSCILSVPLQKYDQNFSFIVNGKEFKTSLLISELLSQKICQIHSVDPTIDTYIINTEHQGDFSRIINLSSFKEVEIPENEVEFFAEVIQKLDNKSINISEAGDNEEINTENVVFLIKKHERFNQYYASYLSHEIEFASTHFFEICESKKDELKGLKNETLFNILNSHLLRINTEDQLIDYINELYSKYRRYSNYYETVKFENVSSEKIHEFISIYDEGDMTKNTWRSICQRLEKEIKMKSDFSQRYESKSEKKEEGNKLLPNNNNDFCGIINFLRTQSNVNIENEISITASSCGDSGSKYQPKTVIMYENKSNYFHSKNEPNSWLCIDFKKHQVTPTDYTIRSIHYHSNDIQPKSWKLEGSIDNGTWVTLDEQTNCSVLNGDSIVHTFHINQQNIKEKYRYIRIKETGTNWRNDNYLCINAIEIYGTLF